MGSLGDHVGVRSDHGICSLVTFRKQRRDLSDSLVQVPRVRLHLVGYWHHGHRLLHGCLCVDDGDSGWKVQDLHQHVYELLLALVSSDHCR